MLSVSADLGHNKLNSLVHPLAGGERAMVVLFLEGDRTDGHGADGAAQEVVADHVPARVPPRHDAEHLVVGHDLHTGRTL